MESLGETNNKFQDYLKNQNKNSFFLKEIEPVEEGKFKVIQLNKQLLTFSLT